MNTIANGKGVANGELKYWIDGHLIHSLDDILFRTGAQPNLKFRQLLFGPYFHDGVPQSQKFWVDDILIQTNIPSGQDTTPPSPPKGLHVVE